MAKRKAILTWDWYHGDHRVSQLNLNIGWRDSLIKYFTVPLKMDWTPTERKAAMEETIKQAESYLRANKFGFYTWNREGYVDAIANTYTGSVKL